MLTALIMAGGSGTRFWPMSREKTPKQYLKINSDKSMIRETLDRLSGSVRPDDTFVITSNAQKPLVERELPELPADNIILEPFGMNTAPAIALSSLFLSGKYKGDDLVFVLPSDHVIKNTEAFIESLKPAGKMAEKGCLVAFGVKPAYPATGYGYIEAGASLGDSFKVVKFKEKPDARSAAKFIEKGNYYWNSGIFLWRIDAILDSFEKLTPAIFNILTEIKKKWDTEGENADISAEYAKMQKISVDTAIMEKCGNSVVVPVDYGWSDVGGWKALSDIMESDSLGNVISSRHELIDSRSNFVKSDKLIAMIGVNNLIVVDTPDALLIADKNSSEKVRGIIKELERKGLKNYL
jgi:mannose-1-phosphate guanylyltransferase